MPLALPAGKVQPLAGAHPSTVPALPSEHASVPGPAQGPLWQTSPVVQAFASLHVVPFGFAGLVHAPLTHEPGVWHWSGVGHTTALPTQFPPWQASPVVQALP